MTSKKTPLTLNKFTKTSPTANYQKILLIVGLLLLFAIIGYFWMQANPPAVPTETVATDSAQSDAASEAVISAEVPEESAPLDENMDTLKSEIPDADPEAILNAPLPETDSLAKEEIDRLADEYQRLIEQGKIAEEQVAMTKSVTDMKAEQIALLEQRIEKMEAEKLAAERQ